MAVCIVTCCAKLRTLARIPSPRGERNAWNRARPGGWRLNQSASSNGTPAPRRTRGAKGTSIITAWLVIGFSYQKSGMSPFHASQRKNIKGRHAPLSPGEPWPIGDSRYGEPMTNQTAVINSTQEKSQTFVPRRPRNAAPPIGGPHAPEDAHAFRSSHPMERRLDHPNDPDFTGHPTYVGCAV